MLLSYAEHERLEATLDVLGDRAPMRQVRRSLRFYGERERGLSFERVFSVRHLRSGGTAEVR